jgi:aerobic carbon-monoxide dehydrogenase medium subunit
VKPAPFEYDDPREVHEALDLLARHGDDAKILAGGQSLVPLLNFRLARPARLVDVNRLDELAYVRKRDGRLRIGALARMHALERSSVVGAGWPLLREAARFVAHPAIRARGTVCGSVAHADPAAELPAALAALDARFHVRSTRGSRTVAAEELFLTHLTTTLEPDELLAEIEVPPLPPGTGTAFVEHARIHGDFALAGAATVVTLAGDRTCERATIALCAAAPTPVRATQAEEALVGEPIDERTARAAAALAAEAVDVPEAGMRYRRALVSELTARALQQAAERAQ